MDLTKVSEGVVHQWAVELLSRRGDIDMAEAIDSFSEYVSTLPEPEVVTE